MAETAAPRAAITNIMVMTDFSPASEVALRYAAGWARRLHATVQVVHFMRPASYSLAGDAYGQLMEQLWKDSQEGLDAIEAGEVLSGVAHATRLHPGDIWDGLPALVTEYGIDLIVLATTGRTGLSKVMLGSTAETVFRTMPCPVLVLGPGAGAYASFEVPRSVLLATDIGAATPGAVRHAVALTEAAGASLHALYVLPPTDEAYTPGVAAAEHAEARLRALLASESSPVAARAKLFVRFGHPAEEILACARAVAADVIVLGARRPPKLAFYTGWATAYQVMGHAPCPVLTVRE
ncbi:MAG TPA: universal stress protein [Terriglobales bacterium]|nr:universal stress protein [Terriglobales bacterium]